MRAVQLLGQIQGVANGALAVLGANGLPREVEIAADAGQAVLAVATADPAAAERVAAVVGHLEGRGSLRDALAAHCPHLPAGHLAAALAFVDGLTEAVADDGQIDAGEIMAIVAAVVKEAK